jgi:hypothetical protein
MIEEISRAGGGVLVITDKWKHDPQRVQLMQSVRLLPGVPSDATVDIDIFPLNRTAMFSIHQNMSRMNFMSRATTLRQFNNQYQEYPISYGQNPNSPSRFFAKLEMNKTLFIHSSARILTSFGR